MFRLILICAAMLAATPALAGGFEQPNHSAAAAGVANAYAATASDPSALIYNPAGIAWLPGFSLQATGNMGFRNSSVIIPAGVAPNNGSVPFSGGLFMSWVPRDGNWGAGFGFAPLYQLDNDWSVGFPGRADLARMTIDHATFDGVYAINSDLAVGLGGDWYITRATLRQGAASFHGRDFGAFGGHLSVKWKPAPAWSLAATYRSGASVSVTQGVDKLAFTLPDHALLAVARDFNDVWRLEADLKWSRWSQLKNLNVVGGGVVKQRNPLNLRDTISAMVGLTWTWREHSQLRFGYAYEMGANRLRGFNPIVADQDGHRVTIGAGGDVIGIHFDLAYQYIFFVPKAAKGAFAGTYRDRQQSLLLSVSKSFE